MINSGKASALLHKWRSNRFTIALSSMLPLQRRRQLALKDEF